MTDHVLDGAPPVPLLMRRSARARRISLRVSQLDGRVTLTLPGHVPEAEALDFARSKEAWIRQNLAGLPAEGRVAIGAHVPIEGALLKVVHGAGRRVVLTADQVLVPGDPKRAGVRLAIHLKQLARDRLAQASDHYAAQLGKTYSRLTIRDTRSRWGSCTSAGGLMYSWRLILAPSEVLRYVAAHEVAHLAEMNHSPAFWHQVARIHGPYETERNWLRTQGAGLHRIVF